MSRPLGSLAIAAVLLAACGEPTDRPEDCTANQFFDESRKLCVTCPAVPQPDCSDRCGFRIVTNSRGCPETRCIVGDDCCVESSDGAETCQRCDSNSYVDPETLTCEPCAGPTSCDAGEPSLRIADGQCTRICP